MGSPLPRPRVSGSFLQPSNAFGTSRLKQAMTMTMARKEKRKWGRMMKWWKRSPRGMRQTIP